MPLLIVLFLLLTPSILDAQEAFQQNTISVSGSASVQRQPDQVVVLLSVESFGESARDAAADNAQKMDAVIRALRNLGLDQNQIKTIGYSVNPEYDQRNRTGREQGEDHLIGYRARNTVEATTNDIDQAGSIIDAALNAGANRVTNLSFRLRDPEAARHDALRLAIGKARAEAATIAGALDRQLGPALTVSTTGAFPAPRSIGIQSAAVSPEMALAPPLEPGLLEVQAQVSIIFRLEP